MRNLWEVGLPLVAVALLAFGSYVGLVVVPRETFMGDVYRIMFMHVPTAWAGMLAFAVTFGASVAYLLVGDLRADALAKATAEVGVVFSTLLLATGALWGRPAWGEWWSWDPRLTTAVVMWLGFAGYLVLRRFLRDAEKRATWSAVVAIIVSVDIPVMYMSVDWWTGLHQIQSSPSTMAPEMYRALMLNAVAFTLVAAWFSFLRYDAARRRQGRDARAGAAGSTADGRR